MIDKRPNGSYRVRLYYRARYVGSRTFARKKDAQAFERDAKTALAAGRPMTLQKSDRVTVNDWTSAWLESKAGGKPSSQEDRRWAVDSHVLPAFGKRPVTLLTHSEIATWARNLAVDKSPTVARRALAALRSALGLALRDGSLAVNPALGIALPAQAANEPRPLTHAEVKALADAMTTDRDRLLVLVAAYGGFRWGEVTALRVSSLNEDCSVVRVTEAWSDTNGVLTLGTTKTHSARSVVLPSQVAKHLKTFLSQRKHTKSDAKFSEELLFHGITPQTPLRNQNWRKRQLNPAIARAQLNRPVTPHHFRDTAASLAISAGASVMTVSRMLGHRDAATTLRHYAQAFNSDLSDVAKLLNEQIKLDD